MMKDLNSITILKCFNVKNNYMMLDQPIKCKYIGIKIIFENIQF